MSRKHSAGCELDMTPMIDVVFQMIIFFIVTVKFTENINEDIILENGPQAPVIDSKQSGTTMVVEVDKRGWISLNGAQTTAQQLRELIKRRYDRMGEFPVLIRGDYRTRHRDIRTVMDICSESGIYQLTFVAIKEPRPNGRGR